MSEYDLQEKDIVRFFHKGRPRIGAVTWVRTDSYFVAFLADNSIAEVIEVMKDDPQLGKSDAEDLRMYDFKVKHRYVEAKEYGTYEAPINHKACICDIKDLCANGCKCGSLS